MKVQFQELKWAFHLSGKLLFTWLSLVMSMVVSFCAVLFPTGCLGRDLELN